MDATADVALDPARTYDSLNVLRSGITIEGNGALIRGSSGHPSHVGGAGILAEGVHDVTLRNLRVRGFRVGLHLKDCRGWTIEECDFSDNFHDPNFGWGEQEPGGGLLLEGVTHSAIRGCRANNVWNACHLVDSADNVINRNDFSHTSNTCLKLWASSRNEIAGNNLSYGIRIAPGEVHARDSSCVLIEHGSNDNRIVSNDARYGGDGIFVRVLDGVPSSGNLFRENDASFAHNNCFESAAPGNTFLENTANGGSYGFWLGCSDRTVLIGNEAGWNGRPDGYHNAPEPGFGHGGIVVVNGSGEHILAARNYCHHNNGGGIVLRGDISGRAAFRSFHWLIQGNRLEWNRWGVYMEQADSIDLGPNTFEGNAERDTHVSRVTHVRALAEPLAEQEWLAALERT